MNKKNNRITVKDVARMAGVSTAAAGRALGGYGYVSEELREKIMRAAEELGYVANQVARAMITGKSQTIGVVGADISNPFFAEALRGISDIARRHEFGVLITSSDEDVPREQEAVRILLEKQVDGLIVSPADINNCHHLDQAIAQGIPVVLLDRKLPTLAADAVLIDNVHASREATRYLLSCGHRRIAIITELSSDYDTQLALEPEKFSTINADRLNSSGARLLGYLLAHHEAGVAVEKTLIRRTGKYCAQHAFEETLAVLDTAAPTAVFAVDNVMTQGAWRAVRERGIAVPQKLSFFAFDELDWLTLTTPRISTVAQPIHHMGVHAAELLFRRIRETDLPVSWQTYQVEMKLRESVAPIAENVKG